MQLSNSDIESICEAAYNRVVNSWCDLDLLDSEYAFIDNSQGNFNSFTYPQLANRLTSTQGSILHKWKEKLTGEARKWYEDKTQLEKDKERRRAHQKAKEERKEQEEEERHQTKQIDKHAKRRSKILDSVKELVADEDIEKALASNNPIKELEFLKDRADDDLVEAMGRFDEYLDQIPRGKRKSDELDYLWKIRTAAENKYNYLFDLLCTKRREEKERLQAAKRKDQEEVNRRKLAEIQKQWNSQNITLTIQKPTSIASTCPNCGSQVSKSSKFCTACGTKILVACANCGANIKASSKFCTNCGSPLSK